MEDGKRGNTKERLTWLAFENIQKSGYAALSQRKLAKSFGISDAAFYNHFQNKNDLLLAALKVASKYVYDLFCDGRDAGAKDARAVGSLLDFWKFLLTMFRREPFLMEFLFFSPSAVQAYAQTAGQHGEPYQLVAETFRLVDLVIEEHRIPLDRETLLIKWWSFLLGYALLIFSSVMEYRESAVDEAVMDVIGKYLENPAE